MNSVTAQVVTQWECYPNYTEISCLLDLDTAILAACASGGLSCINTITSQVTYYNSCNSGLVGGSVYALEKDPDGSIWIGTNCALIKWQGNNWTSYTPQNSILWSGVSALRYHQPQNVLYAGLYAGGVIRIDTSGWSFVTGTTATMPDKWVTDIEIDLNGNIWTASFKGKGAYMFDGLNWQHFNSSNSPLKYKVASIAVDSAGIMWFADIHRLRSYNGSTWTTYIYNTMPSLSINYISIEENNTKYLSTNTGLYLVNGTTFSPHPVNSVLSDIRLRYHLKGKDQKLWTGMWTYGVDYADGMNVTHFPLIKDQESSTIRGIAFDKAQSLVWFATGDIDKPTFLCSFDGTNWQNYNNSNSPTACPISSAIAVDSNSTVYLGTLYEGIWVKQGNNWTNFNSTNSSLMTGSISSLAVDSMNRLLIGLSKGQIQYFMNGAFYTLVNNPMISCPVNHIKPDLAGSFWASTDSSGVIYSNYTSYTIYNTSNSGLPSNIVRDIKVDHMNRCWFATLAGAVVYDGQNWTTFNTSNSGLPSDNLFALTIAPDSSIWFTYSNGIIIFDGTSWNNHTFCDFPFVFRGSWIPVMETGPDNKLYHGWIGLNIVHFDYLTSNHVIETEPSKLTAYPNPGSGIIRFAFQLPERSTCRFHIYNSYGQEVYGKRLTTTGSVELVTAWDTDIGPIPAGIYFYSLTGENIRQSGKVVVQR